MTRALISESVTRALMTSRAEQPPVGAERQRTHSAPSTPRSVASTGIIPPPARAPDAPPTAFPAIPGGNILPGLAGIPAGVLAPPAPPLARESPRARPGLTLEEAEQIIQVRTQVVNGVTITFEDNMQTRINGYLARFHELNYPAPQVRHVYRYPLITGDMVYEGWGHRVVITEVEQRVGMDQIILLRAGLSGPYTTATCCEEARIKEAEDVSLRRYETPEQRRPPPPGDGSSSTPRLASPARGHDTPPPAYAARPGAAPAYNCPGAAPAYARPAYAATPPRERMTPPRHMQREIRIPLPVHHLLRVVRGDLVGGRRRNPSLQRSPPLRKTGRTRWNGRNRRQRPAYHKVRGKILRNL